MNPFTVVTNCLPGSMGVCPHPSVNSTNLHHDLAALRHLVATSDTASIALPLNPSPFTLIHPPTYTPTHASMHLSIHLPTQLSIHPSIDLPVHLSNHLSTHLHSQPASLLSTHLSIYPSVHPAAHPLSCSSL